MHSPATLTAKDLGLSDLQAIVGEQEETLDVLDLPQLYTKPSAGALLAALAELTPEPLSWETTPIVPGTPQSPLSGISTPLRSKRKIRSEGLPRYLTNIISSRLQWIETDDERDQIWETASRRLGERSGRTAQGDLTRTFEIPILSSSSDDSSTQYHLSDAEAQYLQLTLHEPALTSDNLGLKTWASAYLLARRMKTLRSDIPSIPDGGAILELGSGTGLVGLATAAIWKSHVILTDLPEIISNLERNSTANVAAISRHGGSTECAVLDWSKPEAFSPLGDMHDATGSSFRLILAADPIYSAEHPQLLVRAIGHHLSRDRRARVVTEMPLRDGYAGEREDFCTRMGASGLVISASGEEVGLDDWGGRGDDDEPTEVRCWWSVWQWR